MLRNNVAKLFYSLKEEGFKKSLSETYDIKVITSREKWYHVSLILEFALDLAKFPSTTAFTGFGCLDVTRLLIIRAPTVGQAQESDALNRA